jgi:hypothetical protein
MAVPIAHLPMLWTHRGPLAEPALGPVRSSAPLLHSVVADAAAIQVGGLNRRRRSEISRGRMMLSHILSEIMHFGRAAMHCHVD